MDAGRPAQRTRPRRLAPLVAASLLIAGPATAADRYVDSSGTSAPGCTSPSAPCRTVGYTLGQSFAADVLHLATGTYVENLLVDRNVSISGAGPTTVLDGGRAGPVVRIDPVASVTLADLTVTNGERSDEPGGGIVNDGNLVLERVEVVGNRATGLGGDGGGIYAAPGSTLTVRSSVIAANEARNHGGLWIEGADATIDDSRIAAPQCDVIAPATACTDGDAFSDGEDRLFYQVVSACGSSASDEGPLF